MLNSDSRFCTCTPIGTHCVTAAAFFFSFKYFSFSFSYSFGGIFVLVLTFLCVDVKLTNVK